MLRICAIFCLILIVVTDRQELYSNVRQLTFDGTNLHPVLSQDGNFVSFTSYGASYNNLCPQIYRLDLRYPHLNLTRVTAGVGAWTRGAFIGASLDMLVESNIEKEPLSNFVLKDLSNPCISFHKCSDDVTIVEQCFNTTSRSLPYTEHSPESLLYIINKYGNIIYEVNVLYKDEPHAQPAVSPDGRIALYVGQCGVSGGFGANLGTCVFVMPIEFTDQENGALTKPKLERFCLSNIDFHGIFEMVISVKPFEGMVAKNFYHNGPSFHPDGDNIVFCGASIPQETKSGIHAKREKFCAFTGSELFTGNLSTGVFTKIEPKVSPTEESEIIARLFPKFVGNSRKIVYVACYNHSFNIYYRLRLMDADSGDDTPIPSPVDWPVITHPFLSLNGSKLLFVAGNDSSSEDGYQVFISDFHLLETINARGHESISNYAQENDEEVDPFVTKETSESMPDATILQYSGEEKYFTNVRQLTFGGIHSKAMFSHDDNKLFFQARGGAYESKCDQVYLLDLTHPDGKDQISKRLSTGLGANTFHGQYPGSKNILIGSSFITQSAEKHCIKDLTKVDALYTAKEFCCVGGLTDCHSDPCDRVESCLADKKFGTTRFVSNFSRSVCNHTDNLWILKENYTLYKANEFGTILEIFQHNFTFNGEAAFSRSSLDLVYTTTGFGHQNNPDIINVISNVGNQTWNEPGAVKWLSDGIGFKGGAVFSPDGSKMAFHGFYVSSIEDIDDFEKKLSVGLVNWDRLNIFVVDMKQFELHSDRFCLGKWYTRQVTNTEKMFDGKRNSGWAPWFLNDGKRIIFAMSSFDVDQLGTNITDLYLADIYGQNLQQVTYSTESVHFDGYPTFNSNGTKIVWASSRNSSPDKWEINLFMADWILPEKVSAIANVTNIGHTTFLLNVSLLCCTFFFIYFVKLLLKNGSLENI